MRQVFSSPRLENVEAVAEMLREAGIDVHISNGRSYKGNRRSHFSYRASAQSDSEPAVWIVRSEDQPRAREMLREAGLFAERHSTGDSYLPASARGNNDGTGKSPWLRISRIRMALLVVLAIVVVVTLMRML